MPAVPTLGDGAFGTHASTPESEREGGGYFVRPSFKVYGLGGGGRKKGYHRLSTLSRRAIVLYIRGPGRARVVFHLFGV